MLTKKPKLKNLTNINVILIIIIIIVILVGLLGVAVGYELLKSQPTQIIVQNTTNSSPTVSNNTDIQQSNGKSNETSNSGITATQAKEIALNYIGPGWDAIYVGYEDSDYYSSPCYQVEVRNPTTHVSQDLYVDAKTGDMINP